MFVFVVCCVDAIGIDLPDGDTVSTLGDTFPRAVRAEGRPREASVPSIFMKEATAY